MAKILLVDPAFAHLVDGCFPPTGLCRVARHLEDHGHEVVLVGDALNEGRTDILRVIEREAPSVVGFGAMTMQIPRVRELRHAIHEAGRERPLLVLGGPHVSLMDDPEPYLDGFDAVVRGDGEQPMLEILNGARGLLYGSPDHPYVPIEYSQLEGDPYTYWSVRDRRAAGIMTSQGCFGRCKFCCTPTHFGRKLVEYDLAAVVDNMELLSRQHGFRAFQIWDDLFTARPSRVREFCERVAPKGWALSCLARADTVRPKDLKRMREAGFQGIAIGVESGSEPVLRLAQKDILPDRVRRAARDIREAGLALETLWIIGLPGETLETARESIRLAEELGATVYAQFYKAYPGSAFHREIESGQHGTLLNARGEDFDPQRPAFLPEGMTEKQLRKLAAEWAALQKRAEKQNRRQRRRARREKQAAPSAARRRHSSPAS
jgi:radical SAM superfamily enzyme YgiQ (UPF0313 family)